jgi:hypothetical protein
LVGRNRIFSRAHAHCTDNDGVSQARSLVVLTLLTFMTPSMPAHAQAQPARPTMEEDDRLVTRHGPVVLEKSEEGAPKQWRVRLNDRTLVETEDDELGLWELFEGDDGRDYVIMRRSSGGIACPYQFRVIEAGPKGAVRVSDEFGSCLDPQKTTLYGNTLVLEMRSHIPHPELLSAREIRERKQTVEIYTVRDGRITKRDEMRK